MMMMEAVQLFASRLESACDAPVMVSDLARSSEPLEAVVVTLVASKLVPGGGPPRRSSSPTAPAVQLEPLFLLACSFREYARALQTLDRVAVWCAVNPVVAGASGEAGASPGLRLRADVMEFSHSENESIWRMLGTSYRPSIFIRLGPAFGG